VSETSKNMDVFEESTGMCSWRVSEAGTRSAAVSWHNTYRIANSSKTSKQNAPDGAKQFNRFSVLNS
ncbi:MAG: hypothetical protein WBS20_01105, partial [Lysobacterales bacterium]